MIKQKIIQEIATGKSSVGSKYSSTKLKQPTQMSENLNSKSPVKIITKFGKSQVDPVTNKHLKGENYVDDQIAKANAKIEKTRVENLNNQKKMQHKADKSYKKGNARKAIKNAMKDALFWRDPKKNKTLVPIEG